MCCLLFFINVFISLTIWIFERILKYNLTNPHFVRLLLLCYNTQGGTGGVSLQTKTFPVYKNVLKFQNEYNKVEIELRVVQFWTEIKLVITNRTPASRSCDFVITRLISVQIALHSVQLPLLSASAIPLTSEIVWR